MRAFSTLVLQRSLPCGMAATDQPVKRECDRPMGGESRETTHLRSLGAGLSVRLQRRTRCCGDPETGSNQGNGRRARCAQNESAGQCRWFGAWLRGGGSRPGGRRRSCRQARRFPPVSRHGEEPEATWQSIFAVAPVDCFAVLAIVQVQQFADRIPSSDACHAPPPCGQGDSQRSSERGGGRRICPMVQEWFAGVLRASCKRLTTPTPSPSPQGQGNRI